jgi:UDP:flavonoid glycosyltransferase YjiC (YdhE family)
MLVVPFGHDQFDNAARVRRLGAGETARRGSYDTRVAARLLGKLLEDPAYAAAAARVREKIRAEDGCTAAAGAIEAVLKA